MKANFGAFFSSTYRAFKTNLAPLLDENFLYKKRWGAVEPNRRPKPKIVDKQDTISWKNRKTNTTKGL